MLQYGRLPVKLTFDFSLVVFGGQWNLLEIYTRFYTRKVAIVTVKLHKNFLCGWFADGKAPGKRRYRRDVHGLGCVKRGKR